MLIATRRLPEAERSYRATCAQASCDPSAAAYYACVRSSGSLWPTAPPQLLQRGAPREEPAVGEHASAGRRHHVAERGSYAAASASAAQIFELPQPAHPLHLDRQEPYAHHGWDPGPTSVAAATQRL